MGASRRCKNGKQQVRPLRSPGFPVGVVGVGQLHAAFSTESRTRGRRRVARGRKSGYAPVPRQAGTGGMTILWENQRNGNLCARAGAHCRSLHCATPNFLSRLVASANFMRLSLRKAAHAALSSAAWQEIRVRSGRDDKWRVGTFIRGRQVGWTEKKPEP